MDDRMIPWNPVDLRFERRLPSREAVSRAFIMLKQRMGPEADRLLRTEPGSKATFDCAVLLIAELLEKTNGA